MANEKDAAETTLESLNDVFSDIVNVLLFDGKQKVMEDELEQARELSVYPGDDRIREQERDTAKYWRKRKLRLALYGIENQTEPDRDMPLRVIGYDGAGYRDQLYSEKDEAGDYRRNRNARYGVVTIVLYFGMDHWTAPRTLLEALDEVDEDLKPFINDYKLHVFEVAWLSDEQVGMFQSDFRFVADYFMQMRKKGRYVGAKEKIRHINEFMNLMTALTGDHRYVDVVLDDEKGEVRDMDHFLDTVEERGVKRGLELNMLGLIRRKLAKGKDLEEICEDLDEQEEALKGMYEVAVRFSQDASDEEVYAAYQKEREAVLN